MLSESMDGSCRLRYFDPESGEEKGSIPWSAELHAELLPRGHFRVHTPGRTYYLTASDADEAMAERWVRALTQMQCRHRSGFRASGDELSQGLHGLGLGPPEPSR